jgi:hypothetical protein
MRRCDGGPPIAIPFPGRVGWKKSKENDNYGAPIKNVDIIWSLFEVLIGTPNSAIIIVNKFITKHSIFSIIPSNRVYGNPNRRLLSALGDDRDNVTHNGSEMALLPSRLTTGFFCCRSGPY